MDPFSINKLNNEYYVLRHGKSEANEKGIITSDPSEGKSSYDLVKEGKNQVRDKVKNFLKQNHLSDKTIIISSEFKRALETANIAKEILGSSHIIISPKLNERYFGKFDKTHNSNYEIVWNEDKTNPDHKTNDVESVNEVFSRTTSLIEDLEKKYSGQKIILVSHGDALQILQTFFERKNPAEHRYLNHLETAELRGLELKPRIALPKNYSNSKIKKYFKIVLLFILLLLAILVIFVIKEYRYTRRLDYMKARESLFQALHGPKPITVNDVASIQTWMTFDYINHLFSLPTDYLKNSLSITDARYPKLTIARYSSLKNSSPITSLVEIQDSIKTYFAQKQ